MAMGSVDGGMHPKFRNHLVRLGPMELAKETFDDRRKNQPPQSGAR